MATKHRAGVEPCPAEGHGDRWVVTCTCGLRSQCWKTEKQADDLAMLHATIARLVSGGD